MTLARAPSPAPQTRTHSSDLTEFHLGAVAVWEGAQLAVSLLGGIMDTDAFPGHRSLLLTWRRFDEDTMRMLAQLIPHPCQKAGKPRRTPAYVAEDVTCMRSIGWSEFLIAEGNFRQATLYRMNRLVSLALPELQSTLQALITRQTAHTNDLVRAGTSPTFGTT
ncbi:hypothetical protein RHA1_ro10395 (plasmid) [Rhodococcus jostii RHA1]|jgi:hypothetical protein|uniref:Uncharacterized protein n=1 Tax=Rhodococcus jostii (strain RHA1) TaxID=101510 RepID=Q0RVV2_RHOJR|nr:hypothetical protein RHA1_ro10395 [Rhodococcus jostii RHA1]